MIGLVIGIICTLLTVGLNTGVNDYIERQISAVGGDNILMVTPHVGQSDSFPVEYKDTQDSATEKSQQAQMQAIMQGGASAKRTLLNEDDIKEIEQVQGVESVQSPSSPAIEYVRYQNGDRYEFQVRTQIDGLKTDDLAGGQVSNDDGTPEVELDMAWLDVFDGATVDDPGAFVGKMITVGVKDKGGIIKEFDAKVAGILNKNIINSGGSVINTAFIDTVNQIKDVDLQKKSYQMLFISGAKGATIDDMEQVAERIKNLRKDDAQRFDVQTFKDMLGSVLTVVNLITIVLLCFAIISLFVSAFGVASNMLVSVKSREREIGLMRSMGMGKFKVFIMFSIESILIGIWSSIVSVLVTFSAATTVNHYLEKNVMEDLTGFTVIELTPVNIGFVVLSIVFVTFIAGAIPSVIASRKSPLEALRHE
jgi:putative ABC transport system permease protein